MASKRFVKAFVSGMAFPAFALPILYTLLFTFNSHVAHAHMLSFIPMYIPLLWGLANALYIEMQAEGSKGTDIGLWITGACLGFIVALLGIFVFQLPEVVLGFNHTYDYAPLVLLPILYGLFFRYIVKWLNKLLAL